MTDIDPFAQFKTVFFTECDELTADMEQHLSDLQSGIEDSETLNAIFRAVHSIKAGAGAFQYDGLVNFSHIFEALLDKLRTGELTSTQEITQILFSASDILTDLIEAAQNDEILADDYGFEVKSKLENFLQETGVNTENNSHKQGQETAFNKKNLAKYSIRFIPNAGVFKNANEPILLIRELVRHQGKLGF